jgi:hypothetical protein
MPTLFCSLAFGQIDSNSITVTASNNVSLQPDQAVFGTTVQSGINTGLDDVLMALQGSGIRPWLAPCPRINLDSWDRAGGYNVRA